MNILFYLIIATGIVSLIYVLIQSAKDIMGGYFDDEPATRGTQQAEPQVLHLDATSHSGSLRRA